MILHVIIEVTTVSHRSYQILSQQVNTTVISKHCFTIKLYIELYHLTIKSIPHKSC